MCIAEEIPFEIPESWAWCRLGNLIEVIGGTSYDKKDTRESGIRILRGGNIINMEVELYDDDVFLSEKYRDENKQVRPGDIVIVASTGSKAVIGKPGVIRKELMNTQIGAFLRIIRPKFECLTSYIQMIFSTEYYREHIRNLASGTNINNVKADYIQRLFIPLPPLPEQKRIVSKIAELQPFIDEYSVKEQQTRSLNDFFPDQLRKSILQYAVQGKLVPQDPEDEPASVLLDRICVEKERLIQEGKIKRDKHESVIYRRDNSHYEKIDGFERCIDDEIPFEIPESWEWCRLENIMIKITDGTHHSPLNDNNGAFMYVTAKNIKEDGVDLTDITFVSELVHKEIYARCDPEMNDILLIKDGATAGIVTVNNLTEPFSMLSSVALLKPSQNLVPWYIVYCMRSDMFYQIVRKKMKGTGIPRITLKQIYPFLLPVPPYKEQERIVQKIQQIFSGVDKIPL